MLNFWHAFDIPHRTALRERAHEKAKEQYNTLENHHPPHGFRCSTEMECVRIKSRLVIKHEDDESRRAVERSDVHGNAKGVQKVGLPHVFGGSAGELVAGGAEAVAEGIDNGAEDQAIDQKHLYPKPLFKSDLLFGHACSVDSG